MADEDGDDREDPKDAEIRRLKSENAALQRRVSRLEGYVRAKDGEDVRRQMNARKKRTLDPGAADALNRPWDGR